MNAQGRKDRNERLLTPKSGAWGTHHSPMIRLTLQLYRLSRSEASSSTGGNASSYPFAGIPLLVSALQSFIIEYESIVPSDGTCLEPLTRGGLSGLLQLLQTQYAVQGNLLNEARNLIEVRNEMVHPVPLPPGTPDNWPTYLRDIKDAGLAESAGQSPDFSFMAQLGSHRLFAWSCRVTRDLFQRVADSNAGKSAMFQSFVEQFEKIGFDADLP